MTTIRVATRPSGLARAQAGLVVSWLGDFLTGVDWQIVPIRSEGDNRSDVPLRDFGDKAVFVTAIEAALVDCRADIAVHSLKDLPLQSPVGLSIPTYLPRADSRDALISASGKGLSELPTGARVGTSSLRRVGQLTETRPDLIYADIRGNVDTRLAKMRSGEYDAVILAGAGLKRLGMESHITELLEADVCTPAPGQGIIAVQCRENYELSEELRNASDGPAEAAARSERLVAELVGATCRTPFGAAARFPEQDIHMTAWLERDGTGHRANVQSSAGQWRAAAVEVARRLTAPPSMSWNA